MINSITLYSKTGTNKGSLPVLPGTTYKCELMTNEYIDLQVSMPRTANIFALGDYILYNNKKYKILELDVKSHTYSGGYKYQQKFYAEWEEWARRCFFYDRGTGYEAGWKMTQRPGAFLDLVCSNLSEQNFGTWLYRVDAKLTDMKLCSFEETTDIVSALNTIAETWDAEWWLTYEEDGNYINLGACNIETDTITLEDITDIKGITKAESQNANKATRLYCFGSDRNISRYYRKLLQFTAQDATLMDKVNAKLPTGYTAAVIDGGRRLNVSMWDDDCYTYRAERSFTSSQVKAGNGLVRCSTEDSVTLGTWDRCNLDMNDQSGQFTTNFKANLRLTAKVKDSSAAAKFSKVDAYLVIKRVDNTSSKEIYRERLPIEAGENIAKTRALDITTTIPMYNGEAYYWNVELNYMVTFAGMDENWPERYFCEVGVYLENINIKYRSNNPSVAATLKIGNTTYNGIFNPLFCNEDSDYYNMIAYTGARVANGTQYYINNINKYDVPASCFTSMYKNVKDGVAESHLMPPQEPLYRGTNGQLYYESEKVAGADYDLVYDGLGYVDAKDSLTNDEVIEGVVMFDDVYPRQICAITAIDTDELEEEVENDEETPQKYPVYYIKADELTGFKSKDWAIAGVDLKVTFQTGDMAGMIFDVVAIEDEYLGSDDVYETYFKIVRNEDYGIKTPNYSLKPKVGDTFILSGFNTDFIDASYVPKAEKELVYECLEYIKEITADTSTYTCSMNPISCIQRGITSLPIGTPVLLSSPIYGEYTSRIRGIEKQLDDRAITYIIGKQKQYSRFATLEQAISGLTYGSSYAYNGFKANGVSADDMNEAIEAAIKKHDAEAETKYLHKDVEDVAEEQIRFKKGIVFGETTDFQGGMSGAKFWHNGSGWCLQCDYLQVTKQMSAKEVKVDEVNHVGGQLLLTSAECVVEYVEETSTLYKVYYSAVDNRNKAVKNMWKIGDMAYCQSCNIDKGTTSNFTNRYYWMLVMGMGKSDDGKYYYISLSKTQRDSSGINAVTTDYTSVPMQGDCIVQLGHVAQKARQGAMFISGGEAGQYIAVYNGIKTFNMPQPKIYISPESVKITADEIKLASAGVLELLSNQLVCKNTSDEKTAWLDDLGNFTTAGIQSQLINKVNSRAKFLDTFVPMPSEELVYPPAYTASDWKDETNIYNEAYPVGDNNSSYIETLAVAPISDKEVVTASSGNRSANTFVSLDMRCAQGVIEISHVPAYMDGVTTFIGIVLPYFAYDVMNQDEWSTTFMRTPTKMNGSLEFVTMQQLKSLIGRKLTIINKTGKVLYILNESSSFIPVESDDYVTLEFVGEAYEDAHVHYTDAYGNVTDRDIKTCLYNWRKVTEECFYTMNDSYLNHDNFGLDFEI